MAKSLDATCFALPASVDDLWDVSEGASVNDTSGVLNYSSSYRYYIDNMFGETGGVEGRVRNGSAFLIMTYSYRLAIWSYLSR